LVLAGCVPGRLPAGAAPARTKPTPKPTSAAPLLQGRNVGVSLYGSVLGWPRADLRRDLDRVRNMGATWVRVPFNWVTLEMHRRGEYNWGPADTIVEEANARHLRIVAVVSYTPGWARPAGRPGTDPPTNLGDYARFMRDAAARYGPKGVHHWEVWNEPNLTSMWTPKPDAAKYTALLKKAYTAVKGADPNAVVMTAGLSPAWDAPDGTQIAPLTFVSRIYANGGGRSFDAIAHHPSTYPYRSTYAASWSAFQQTPDMYRIMRAHGDAKKKVWATEIGFPT
jgi:polysaccharide biosynthesis protein PslG